MRFLMRCRSDVESSSEKISMITPKSPVAYGTRPDTEQSYSSTTRRGWLQMKFCQIHFLLILMTIILLTILILVIILTAKLSLLSADYEKLKVESNGLMSRLGIGNNDPGHPTQYDHSRQLPYPGLTPSKEDYDEMNGGPTAKPIIPIVFGPNTTVSRDPSQKSGSNASLSDAHRWYREGGKCGKMDNCPSTGAPPPLLIVSFDGFAKKYLSRGIVKNLDLLADCGTRAEYVLPSFPSKTFPNHYSIVTGQYPGYHGLVDNWIFDPEVSDQLEDMKRTKYSEFYESDPIWSVYNRETGKDVACQMWLGCAQHKGNAPKYEIPFNGNAKPEAKIDQIISWLSMPESTRPGLVLTYFDEPDGSGHRSKDETTEVNEKLQELDQIIGYLLNQLHDKKLLDCINIAIVSDHGMELLKDDQRYYLDEKMDMTGMVFAPGVVGRLHLNESKQTQDEIAKKLGCNRDFFIYNKTTMPTRLHYGQSDRAGDLILEGQPGTLFYKSAPTDDYSPGGDHGYDYLHEKMHTIFYGRGPNFRRKHVIPPFQNVEYFNMFAELLGITNVPLNNGTMGVLTEALQPNIFRPFANNRDQFYASSSPTRACPLTRRLKAEFCDSCSEQDQKLIESRVSGCFSVWHMDNVHHTESTDVCGISMCDSVSIMMGANESGQSFAVFEKLDTNPSRETATCQFSIEIRKCSPPGTTEMETVMAGKQLTGLQMTRVPMDSYFSKNIWYELQQLTNKYVEKYGQLYSISGTVYNGSTPTHFYRILLKCAGNVWIANQQECVVPSKGETLAFLIPHITSDWNCKSGADLLMTYTARIKDIETMTGLRFFNNAATISYTDMIRRNTFINLKLWEN